MALTHSKYVLHDFSTNKEFTLNGYEAYLDFFLGALKPYGMGTRWLFSEVVKPGGCLVYHYRLVNEHVQKETVS